jgi:FKBP-type peptidyl-prolyl cis-trans isomerase
MNNQLTNMYRIISIFLAVFFAACSHSLYKQTASGLQYRILKKGSGPKATKGQHILLLETTSEALTGMKQGEIKEIVAPPHLVKRQSYPANVHPDSPLVIKLVLEKIE